MDGYLWCWHIQASATRCRARLFVDALNFDFALIFVTSWWLLSVWTVITTFNED